MCKKAGEDICFDINIPQILLLCTLRQERSQTHHQQTPGNPAGFETADFLLVWMMRTSVIISMRAEVGSQKSWRYLTLKCHRDRTATTMAVVVLPLPLEQLNTKAECESSAKALLMASNSLSNSWVQDHTHTYISMSQKLESSSSINQCHLYYIKYSRMRN